MQAKSPLVHIRFSRKELESIDLEVELSNTKHRHRPHTRSSWIREAVAYVLEVQRQRRKVRGPKKFVCAMCGEKIAAGQVALKRDLLTGTTEYWCDKCSKA